MRKAWNSRYFLAALVGLTTFLVYLPALSNGFVNWDDDIYVYDNPQIRSLDGAFFRWAFVGFHISNWHPLTWISHALDYAIWGLNPMGHHLTSIILHAVNTALVVLLVTRLLEISRNLTSDKISPKSSLPKSPESFRDLANRDGGGFSDKQTLIAAAITGLLVGIHPLHVESVAWVAERKDLLCALFFLLSIMAYVRYAGDMASANPPTPPLAKGGKGGPYKYYVLCLITFILALMSKPMAVSLPVVLLILDWYPLNRIVSLKTSWKAIIEKIPFIVLSLASSVLTIFAQKSGGSIVSVESAPLQARILVSAHAIVAYLEKMIVPVNLLPFYPHPQNVSASSINYLLPIVFISAVTVLCIWMMRSQKFLLSAWAYYLVTLIPVLGIVQAGGQSMADRYTYLPSIGPFLVIGLTAAAISKKIDNVKLKWLVVVYSFAAVFIFAFLVYRTIGQVDIWKTSMTLWDEVINKEPDKIPLAYYNRGQVFMGMGQLDRAIEDYTAAITLNPFYHDAFYNRGAAFEKIQQPDKAIADYERAISLNPGDYSSFNNKGILYGTSGLYDKAIEAFSRAIAINPVYPDSYFNRGFTYSLIGRGNQALKDFSKAIELNEQFALAYLHRGKLLLGTNNKDAATDDFRKACALGIKEACSSL